MDKTKWAAFLNRNVGLLVDTHQKYLDAGLKDPVVIVIDPREGAARRYCLANWGADITVADIDNLIAQAEEGQRPIHQLAVERSAIEKLLPTGVELGALDHARAFWVICMEASKVMSMRFDLRLPDLN